MSFLKIDKIGILILIILFNSCMIITPKKLNNSKLSSLIEIKTRGIIEQETQEEIEWIKRENHKLKQHLKKLQIQFDSLKIFNNNCIVGSNDFCFLFFNAYSIKLKNESLNELNSWIGNKDLNRNLHLKLKYNIVSYFEPIGDTLMNISLANDRVLYLKNILTSEYCIADSLISINRQANMNSCNRNLYRSVKIEVLY